MNIDEEYFKSEEFQELLESYEASINAGSNPFMDADDLVDLADYYSWQGFDDKAEAAIDYALELYPSSTLPNVFKARKALSDGDFKQAEFYRDEIDSHDDPDDSLPPYAAADNAFILQLSHCLIFMSAFRQAQRP